jgi:hypothetical protein
VSRYPQIPLFMGEAPSGPHCVTGYHAKRRIFRLSLLGWAKTATADSINPSIKKVRFIMLRS